ncbi:MAG TPA: hypothetical protein ENI57_09425 [Ignavibacteria bacterium]|nr:hypothetical protein [Ignavibacteria bacterium]
MRNKKILGWAFLLAISTLFVANDIITLRLSGNSVQGQAFDTGQIIGILLWVIIAIFAIFKLIKNWKK